MNKVEFIKRLNNKLKGIPAEDKEDAIRFYEDYIAEAGLEDSEEIEAVLGSPEEAARKILGDCTEKQINAQSEKASIKNNTKTIWLILLGIFAAPFALPVGFAVAVIFLSIIIVMFSIDISVLACGVAFTVSSVALIPGIFWADGVGQKLVILGVALIMLPLGILICIGFYKLGGLMVKAIVNMYRKMTKKHRSNENYGNNYPAFNNANNSSNYNGSNFNSSNYNSSNNLNDNSRKEEE